MGCRGCRPTTPPPRSAGAGAHQDPDQFESDEPRGDGQKKNVPTWHTMYRSTTLPNHMPSKKPELLNKFIVYCVAALFMLMGLAHIYVGLTFYEFTRGTDWPHIVHHVLSASVEVAASVWMITSLPGITDSLIMSVILAHSISSPTELKSISKRDFDTNEAALPVVPPGARSGSGSGSGSKLSL